ncbi:MAG: TIGR04283 family arsenosugar biosynthesis glycosyltransferase [Nitrospirae bacterium]|nr:TIGR04283 family arsenosugar biosynthesis glycosyltransferase [Nitrospirota bacterium]
MVSIIIPVLNEEKNIAKALNNISQLKGGKEIIIVDGGSIDNTVSIVNSVGAYNYTPLLLSSQKGRGCQMNRGAEIAKGETLLFLHADTILLEDGLIKIQEALKDPEIIGGRFDVKFDDGRLVFKLIAFLMNWRSRLTGISTGDQAIFIRKDIFKKICGYPEAPLMEDIELSKRMKRAGSLACLKNMVITSARKWKEEGIVRTIILMWSLRLLYFFRVSPEALSRIYYRKKQEYSNS